MTARVWNEGDPEPLTWAVPDWVPAFEDRVQELVTAYVVDPADRRGLVNAISEDLRWRTMESA